MVFRYGVVELAAGGDARATGAMAERSEQLGSLLGALGYDDFVKCFKPFGDLGGQIRRVGGINLQFRGHPSAFVV